MCKSRPTAANWDIPSFESIGGMPERTVPAARSPLQRALLLIKQFLQKSPAVLNLDYWKAVVVTGDSAFDNCAALHPHSLQPPSHDEGREKPIAVA